MALGWAFRRDWLFLSPLFFIAVWSVVVACVSGNEIVDLPEPVRRGTRYGELRSGRISFPAFCRTRRERNNCYFVYVSVHVA